MVSLPWNGIPETLPVIVKVAVRNFKPLAPTASLMNLEEKKKIPN